MCGVRIRQNGPIPRTRLCVASGTAIVALPGHTLSLSAFKRNGKTSLTPGPLARLSLKCLTTMASNQQCSNIQKLRFKNTSECLSKYACANRTHT
jgi:hypothetical protein